MTKEVLEYCMRGIIRYLDGDKDKFQEYTNKAMQIHQKLDCTCSSIVKCKYMGQVGYLCTDCGRIWVNERVVRKCNARKLAG